MENTRGLPQVIARATQVYVHAPAPPQLPEDLISATTRPVSIVWGERDPWEPVELGRKYFAHLKGVKEFIALPGEMRM